jgi:hypothetical protein
VIREIVIARQAQHRHARGAEHVAHPAITLGVVLHQVACQQHAVSTVTAALGIGNRGLQGRQARNATQAPARLAEQVQIAELNETNRLHR